MLSIKHSCQCVWAGSPSLHPTPTPTHHHIISHKFQPPWLCVGRKCFLNRRGDRFLHANAAKPQIIEQRRPGLPVWVGVKRGGGRVGHHQQTAARTCNIYGGLAGVLSAKFNFHSCRVRSLSRVAQKFTFTRVGRALFLAWPEAVWEIKFGWLWKSLVEFREVWFETIWGIFNAIEVTDRNGLKKNNLKIWTSLTLLLKEILSTKL